MVAFKSGRLTSVHKHGLHTNLFLRNWVTGWLVGYTSIGIHLTPSQASLLDHTPSRWRKLESRTAKVEGLKKPVFVSVVIRSFPVPNSSRHTYMCVHQGWK